MQGASEAYMASAFSDADLICLLQRVTSAPVSAPVKEDLSPAAESLLRARAWYALGGSFLIVVVIIAVLLSVWWSRTTPPEKQLLLDQETPRNRRLRDFLRQPVNVLLVLIPIGWAAHWYEWGKAPCFCLNSVAMFPLAIILGDATEELAAHYGAVASGILNATFGNVVELLLIVQSLRAGLVGITKGTLLGSILSNQLLVLGASLFLGGLFDKDKKFAPQGRLQTFNSRTAAAQTSVLFFAACVIAVTSIFEKKEHVTDQHVLRLSRAGAGFALLTYGVYVFFTLLTHPDNVESEDEPVDRATLSPMAAGSLLFMATVAAALSAQFLVDSVEGFAKVCGFSKAFIGVVILPIVGNACEHASAVTMAMKDKVDLAISISLGSSIQVALLVLPFAIFCGWVLGEPMDLDFDETNSWALVLSAVLVMAVLQTGTSHWLNGFLLVATYACLAALFFFEPDASIGKGHDFLLQRWARQFVTVMNSD